MPAANTKPPRCCQGGPVPVLVQRVEADHHVARRAQPGQPPSKPGGEQQCDPGKPSSVAYEVERAAGQVSGGRPRRRQRGGGAQRQGQYGQRNCW